MLQLRFLSRTSRLLVKCRQRGVHTAPLLEELTERGFIQDVTRKEELAKALASKPQGVYTGVDPTASSLHIGHLVPLLGLVHFHLHGHKIVPLIGSATGRIGDPSGRSTERKQQTTEDLDNNIAGLTRSVNGFFQRAVKHASTRLGLGKDRVEGGVEVKSNIDWHEKFSMIDFLQVVGVHARINAMMNRESTTAARSRWEGRTSGGTSSRALSSSGKLSNEGETASPEGAFGITTPLLTTPSGEKFGKSAGNAVWLDENLTSVFDFYQYFLKSPDAAMSTYLKLFTFLPRNEIDAIVEVHNASPEQRGAQKVLAAEVTEMVHGAAALDRVQTLTALLFPTSSSTSSSTSSDYSNLTTESIISAFGDSDPRLVYIPESELVESTPIVKLAKRCGLAPSNSAAKTLVASRGLYMNNIVVPDIQTTVSKSQLINDRVLVLRAGKDKLAVIIAQ
ncbi:tyrosine-tRNA ligase [Ephemerocybe angulata]|uniref:Tyrosine--tRNA ligase n=1 Tax=Ephemerocybe angulata TaxID=980116 RepID=A0A8H6ICG3_9AGAR|nr:tyrosine-tRNA ligase [Tulosesus angulatus]